MAESIQPTNQYYPQIDKSVDHKVSRHLQELYTGTNNHDRAITLLSSQFTSLLAAQGYAVSGSSVTKTSSTASNSVTAAQAQSIANQAIASQFPIQLQMNLGGSNAQVGTSYTIQQSDYSKIVSLDNASPVAVTLNSNVNQNWWGVIENIGAGLATLTPSTGTINDGATITLAQNQGAFVGYDGANWWALTSQASSGGTITSVIAGTGLTGGGSSGAVTLSLIVPVTIAHGGTGTISTLTGLVRGSASAMTAAEISGDATTSGSNALTLATVNANVGSFTNANITVNGKGLVTAAANGSISGANVQTVSLGTGTIAPQTNATVSPTPVVGQSATSIISAYIVGPVGAQPFFIQVTPWWNTTAGTMQIEVSNCSTTLTWTYTGASVLVAVWI